MMELLSSVLQKASKKPSFSISGTSSLITTLSLSQAEKQFGILMHNFINKNMQEEKELQNTSSGAFFLIPPHIDGGEILIVFEGEEKNPPQELFFVYAGKRSRLKISTRTISSKNANVLFYVIVDQEGEVTASTLHNSSGTGTYTFRVDVKNNASFHSNTFFTSGISVHENSLVTLSAQGATTTATSLVLAGNEDHIHSKKKIIHKEEETSSQMLTKTVLGRKSKVDVDNTTLVEKTARKSAAKQHIKALLVAKDAKFSAKPVLDILTSQVDAVHGASSGTLDEEALIYAQTRGISLLDAKKMVFEAFVEDLVGPYKKEFFEKLDML